MSAGVPSHRIVTFLDAENPDIPPRDYPFCAKASFSLGGRSILWQATVDARLDSVSIVKYAVTEPGAMRQSISGFHQDHERHWVAELACGHFQHVRHNPPWINRPWVLSLDGRIAALGSGLDCKKCDQAAPPDTMG
jgi:hypothetical protein